MRRTGEHSGTEGARIVLELLDAVERQRAGSQRILASELGIALGLVNAYLRRCVKKGLVKVRGTPARRYVYFLTPQGLAEKSRLTLQYLSTSFAFFRRAKADCLEQFQLARAAGVEKVVLVGQSDLAEIAALCALEYGVEIVGIVDRRAAGERYVGLPVLRRFEDAAADAALITSLADLPRLCDRAAARFGVDRVYVPNLLRMGLRRPCMATAFTSDSDELAAPDIGKVAS
ncbi:MAG: winged helix-turn-helix transcriptional regulator [Proteobacteria bacterium]|nr:winged helix-turn-helix transcriptional regulator [Pseudomonadota bacterium]